MTARSLDIIMALGAALALLLGGFAGFAEECDEIPSEVLLTLPLPFVSKRKRKPVRCAEIMNFIDSLRGRNPKVSPPRLLT